MTFVVKNVTRHEIAIGDLHAAIKPGKNEDLDRLASRHVINQSHDLKIALRRGALKILRKDDPDSPTALQEVSTDNQNNEQLLKQMQAMEKRLTERMNAQVNKHVDQPKGMDPQAMDQLQQAIAALQNITGGTSQENKTEEYLPDDTSVKIHGRTIDRLTKKVSGQIRQKESSSSSNVDKNIDELEGLL